LKEILLKEQKKKLPSSPLEAERGGAAFFFFPFRAKAHPPYEEKRLFPFPFFPPQHSKYIVCSPGEGEGKWSLPLLFFFFFALPKDPRKGRIVFSPVKPEEKGLPRKGPGNPSAGVARGRKFFYLGSSIVPPPFPDQFNIG